MAAKNKNILRLSKLTSRKKTAYLFNPFEVQLNRSKHLVLGRKDRGEHGLPGLSKQKALQKRKSSLLYEYKTKYKNNKFIDHRIGEKNVQMTKEDKIMARFVSERIHMFKKKSIYSLSHSNVLTHRKKVLSEIDEFEDIVSDNDDSSDENGTLRGKFVESAHFGGGLMTRSNINREDLISELINEAKKRKVEKQVKKEETLVATKRLDDKWETLKSITIPYTDPEARHNNSNIEYSHNKTDAYNILVNTLKLDLLGKTSQPLEINDNASKKDREGQKMVENKRLQQLENIALHASSCFLNLDDVEDSHLMVPYEFSITEDNNQKNKGDSSGFKSEIEINIENEKHKGKMANESDKIQSFDIEYETYQDYIIKSEERQFGKAPLKNENIQNKHISSNTQSPSTNNLHISSSLSSVYRAETEDYFMDHLSDLMPVVDEPFGAKEQGNSSTQTKSNIINRTDKFEEVNSRFEVFNELALPHVLEVPDNIESFKHLVNKYCNKLEVIIGRMIKCNHPSLHPDNNKKMIKLAEYLLQLLSEGGVRWEDLQCLILYWNYLEKFNEKHCIKLLVDTIHTKLVCFTGSPTFIPATKFLVWSILVCSDMRTVETSSALRLVLSIACRFISTLSQFPFENLTEDETDCLPFLICFLLLQDTKKSANVYSDAILFLHGCIKVVLTKMKTDDYTFSDMDSNTLKNNADPNPHSSHFHKLDENCKIFWKMSADQVLCCCVTLLIGFVESLEKYPQSKLLFDSIHKIISQIKLEIYSKCTQKKIKQLQSLLQQLQAVKIFHLVKSEKEIKLLCQYEPFFCTVTSRKFKTGVSCEKNEEQKLLYKYKQEMKGAIRELRKDREFLQNVKLKENMSSDEKRKRKVKEILASAAVQEREWRSFKRSR